MLKMGTNTQVADVVALAYMYKRMRDIATVWPDNIKPLVAQADKYADEILERQKQLNQIFGVFQ